MDEIKKIKYEDLPDYVQNEIDVEDFPISKPIFFKFKNKKHYNIWVEEDHFDIDAEKEGARKRRYVLVIAKPKLYIVLLNVLCIPFKIVQWNVQYFLRTSRLIVRDAFESRKPHWCGSVEYEDFFEDYDLMEITRQRLKNRDAQTIALKDVLKELDLEDVFDEKE